MLGRFATAFIVVFWLTMMAVLAQREILPTYRAARQLSAGTTYAHLEKLAEAGRVSQMGIFLGKRRIGRTVSVFRKVGDELRLQNDTEINLNLSTDGAFMPGGVPGLHVLMRFRVRVAERKLLEFRLTVSSPPKTPPLAVVDGYPAGRTLVLKIKQGGQTRTESVPFSAEQILSSNLAPILAVSELHVGKRWIIRTLDPTTYTVRAVWAEVVAEEPVSIGGTQHEAFLIKIPYGSYEVNVWATPDGEVLKQKVFGFVFLKEQPSPDVLEQVGHD